MKKYTHKIMFNMLTKRKHSIYYEETFDFTITIVIPSSQM